MPKTDTLAARLRAAREQAGLTRQALAGLAGVPYSTILQVEQGRRRDPQVSTVLALARALGTTVERLAG